MIFWKKIPQKKGEYSELLPFCLCMKWTGDNIEWHWVWRGRAKEQHLSSDPPPTAYSTPIHSSDYPALSIHRAAYPPPIHRLSTTDSPPPVFQCNRRCVTKHGRMEIRRVVYAKSLIVFLSLDHYGREQERVSFTRQGRDRRPSEISMWKGGLLPGLKRLQTISNERIWKDNTNTTEHYPGCSR